jgi:hypothetical protein
LTRQPHAHPTAPLRPAIRSHGVTVAAPRHATWEQPGSHDVGSHTDLCVQSDDAFDAVIAALTARAQALKQTTTPAAGFQHEQAKREGWIVLPTRPLSTLIQTPPR